MIYRQQMSNDQFIADSLLMLKGKINEHKVSQKLKKITERATDDYAVDEMERILNSHGYDVLWGEGYRIY